MKQKAILFLDGSDWVLEGIDGKELLRAGDFFDVLHAINDDVQKPMLLKLQIRKVKRLMSGIPNTLVRMEKKLFTLLGRRFTQTVLTRIGGTNVQKVFISL